jgi:hypothetical protein
LPNNICASPSLDKETGFYLDRDGWKWQRETEGKQSATCLQMAGEPARCVKGQESSYYIRIQQKQTKPSKFAKTAGINKQWCQAPLVDICPFAVPDTFFFFW